jgi:putative RecB family exonuclease
VDDEFAGLPERLYVASPSRLLTWVGCPRQYRMHYLDRPRPTARPQRAHTSLGISVHNALRDWWDGPQRTGAAAARLVRSGWIPVGFRDEHQSSVWRERAADEVQAYVDANPMADDPVGTERTLSIKRSGLAVTGRVDRLDARPLAQDPHRYELVVVDYKTTRRPLTSEDARTSLPLALYAAAAWRMFRRRCVRVELHHVPTGAVLAHEHTVESLRRKLDEAASIAADLRRADAAYRRHGPREEDFPARPSPLCRWCDYRAHCVDGQQMGPEQSSWAALESAEASDPGPPTPDGWEQDR